MKGSIIITDPKSVILYSSGNTSRRTGFDHPEIIGKRPGDLWGGLMSKAFYKNMWKEIRSGEGFVGRVVNQKKNGEPLKDVLHIVPILDEDGEAQYFLELHPELNSAEHHRRFLQDFTSTISADANPEQLAQFIERWFALDHGFQTESRQQFLEDIYRRLIAPEQKQFGDRHEDRRLIEKAQMDSEQFQQIYQKYYSNISAFFRFRLPDEALAEDMAQEVFLRAFRALDSYAPSNASYQTYLLRIAHNQLVSHYRGLQNSEVLTGTEPAHDWMNGFLRRDTIERALVSVTDIERVIVQKKYQEGLSVREIASELGRSENAIKLHLSRARKKLKAAILSQKGVR